MRRTRGAAGFTLVEVMIALLIFGMIAAAGVALLAFSVRAQETGGRALDDLGDVNRLASILTADLAQAQDRPTRDADGVLRPSFAGGAADTPMLRFVRGGWTNLDDAPRPSVQKVEYRLSGGAIERVGYPALDGAAPLPAAVLLDRVTQLSWRFRYLGAWSERWAGEGDVPLPQAAELVVRRSDGRSYRFLFLVGSGSPAPRPTATSTPPPTTPDAR